MAICSGCATDLPDGARFCMNCGTPVAPAGCSGCGAPLVAEARFCMQCGTPVSAPVGAPVASSAAGAPVSERRVTSVLFGDLVGFTSLSENRDPEEVRELLSRYFAECRTVIGRYGGAVEKFIGDAVMAVWGVPVAHEDDAERAVRAGLELVAVVTAMGEDVGAPGLAMRVGVVTGEVAVTVGATAEGMVAGDAVNTASRVQSVAGPGQVWVDETTRSLTIAAVAYDDAGEHAVKGKVEPLHLFTARSVVAELGGGQRVDGLEAPLTGRDRELRLVKELFHATQESRRPRLVVIDGEAGVGKSRLAWEFEKYSDGLTAATMWHRGRCLSYGDGVAFWALAEAVRGRLGLTESDVGDVVGARLEEQLATYVSDEAERDWIRPRVAALISAGHTAGFSREDLFAAWTTFFERVAEGGESFVLVLDDAQHADEGLLDFVDHLLATARAGILLLALARPELLARRHDLGGRRATVVRLDPLDDDAMAELVDGLVDGLSPEVRHALVARSEGIPLFAVETVRALIDRDDVVPRGGRYVPADGVLLDLDSIGAPASLQALVAARLDALLPDERRVVADASVLGMSFHRAGLSAVSGEEGLDGVLSALVRKEILGIQSDRLSPERGQYRFVQGVVRQVAYSTQSRRDRKLRHLAAADFLGTQLEESDGLAVVIAQHLLDAVDASSTGDEDVHELSRRATALLEIAAARARALGAPAEAQRLLATALARSDDEVDLARLHLATASAAWDAGAFAACAGHAEVAADLYSKAGLPVDAGVAISFLASATGSLQDHARAIEIAEEAWQALDGQADAGRALLPLARALGASCSARGDFERMAQYAERRILLAEAANDPESLAHAHLQLGIRYVALGAPVTAKALYTSAATISRESGLSNRLALALNNLASITIARDLDAALGYITEGIDAARRSGVVTQIDFTRMNFVLALWAAGRLVEADQVMTDLLDSAVEPSIRVTLPALDHWLAEAVGRPPAVTSFDGLDSDSEGDLSWRGCFDLAVARAAGDVAAAAAAADRTLPHSLASQGLDDDFVHQWPPMVEAALRAGDVPMAERLLAPVAAAEAGVVAPAVAAQFLRLRGLVGAARGDAPAEVERDLRTGAAALTDFGAGGLAARATEDLGRWLLTQGRDSEAEVELQQARATYLRIGANGWLAELADVLPLSSHAGVDVHAG